jgi:glutamyl-tRNA reductase
MQSLMPESPASLRLLVAGLNHRTAPLTLRETVAFSPGQVKEALAQFRTRFPHAELVILSTCNRVEFYLARPLSSEPSLDELCGFIADYHLLKPEALRPHLYHHEDRSMVEHLFAVASSLDSMVVGETQIISQVKHAYHYAANAGGIGGAGVGKGDGSEGKKSGGGGHGGGQGGGGTGVLHALFQRALAAAKDVHDKTELSAGHLSVASVAVDLAASVFDRFDDKTVLCIGAGKMATLMLRHLAGLQPRKLLITNRSPERAHALAAHFSSLHAEARPIEHLDQLLVEADILLTSTGASQPVISETRFKALQKPRRYRPIVMVDIAVPRDVEASIARLSNVYLYNIDDLQEVAAGNRGKRDAEIAASRGLLKEHVDEFLRWFAARDVGPLVKALYEHCHATARGELAAIFARHPEMPAEERAELERLAHRLVGKFLHGPVTQLTTHAEATARPMLTAALKKLFNLDPPVPPQVSIPPVSPPLPLPPAPANE